MTLLIALIANSIHFHMTGDVFADTFTIIVIWIIHLIWHNAT